MSKTMVTSSGGHGMLARFTKKKSTCIKCRAVLDREGTYVYISKGGGDQFYRS